MHNHLNLDKLLL
jgi:hypothetical protein